MEPAVEKAWHGLCPTHPHSSPCQHWPARVRVSPEMISRGCDTDLNVATPGMTAVWMLGIMTAAQGCGCR